MVPFWEIILHNWPRIEKLSIRLKNTIQKFHFFILLISFISGIPLAINDPNRSLELIDDLFLFSYSSFFVFINSYFTSIFSLSFIIIYKILLLY